MHKDVLILILIGVSFLGFMIGLVGRNTNTLKKSYRAMAFYKHLT